MDAIRNESVISQSFLPTNLPVADIMRKGLWKRLQPLGSQTLALLANVIRNRNLPELVRSVIYSSLIVFGLGNHYDAIELF